MASALIGGALHRETSNWNHILSTWHYLSRPDRHPPRCGPAGGPGRGGPEVAQNRAAPAKCRASPTGPLFGCVAGAADPPQPLEGPGASRFPPGAPPHKTIAAGAREIKNAPPGDGNSECELGWFLSVMLLLQSPSITSGLNRSRLQSRVTTAVAYTMHDI